MTDHSATFGNIPTGATAADQVRGAQGRSVRAEPARPGDYGAAGRGEREDIELMARVARGDAEAQRQVTRRLLPRIDGLCRALRRSSDEAVQARGRSMVEILKSAHRFDGASPLERWADRMTVRAALRTVTAETSAQLAPLDLQLEGRDTTPPVNDAALLTRQYLDQVSEQQRMIMILRCRLEYSIDEIAELTGSSQRAIKACLLGARGVMRGMCRREQRLVDLSTGKVVG